VCAKGGCVPYVIVVGVLGVALVCSCVAVDVDCWFGSVGYSVFGDGYVA
jgi:hypothetical protein